MNCPFCVCSSEHEAIVYEDDICIVVMDAYPIVPGHALVIPKLHDNDPFTLPDTIFVHLLRIARLMADALKLSYNVTKIGMLTGGKTVEEHAHVHLLPLVTNFRDTLRVRERPRADLQDLKSAASRIRAVIRTDGPSAMPNT